MAFENHLYKINYPRKSEVALPIFGDNFCLTTDFDEFVF